MRPRDRDHWLGASEMGMNTTMVALVSLHIVEGFP